MKKKVTLIESTVELKVYWVALKLQMWDKISLEHNRPLPFPVQFQKPDGNEIGFLPVFSTCEGALKFVNYDKKLIGQIQEVEQ